SGFPCKNSWCGGRSELDQQLLTVYHFFFRTCAEWIEDLLPKRQNWLVQRQLGGRKWSQSRQDPDFCTNSASRFSSELVSASNAPFLSRFAWPLLEAVKMHPMWGTPVIFPAMPFQRPNGPLKNTTQKQQPRNKKLKEIEKKT